MKKFDFLRTQYGRRIRKKVRALVDAVIAPAPLIEPPACGSPPKVVGDPSPGNTLAAIPGLWISDGPMQLTVQWRRHGEAIPGATEYEFAVTESDLGYVLTVAETATNAGGTATELSEAVIVR